MKTLFVGLGALILVGCTSHAGNRFDQSAVAKLKPGVTTESQAIEVLVGQPVERKAEADGSYTLSWQYIETGWLGSTTDSTLSILFNKSGVMERIVSQGALDVGLGR